MESTELSNAHDSSTDDGPTWKNRRRVIFLTLVFCAGIVLYLTLYGKDTRLHETIANGCLLLAASVIGSYVFGSAYENKTLAGGKR